MSRGEVFGKNEERPKVKIMEFPGVVIRADSISGLIEYLDGSYYYIDKKFFSNFRVTETHERIDPKLVNFGEMMTTEEIEQWVAQNMPDYELAGAEHLLALGGDARLGDIDQESFSIIALGSTKTIFFASRPPESENMPAFPQISSFQRSRSLGPIVHEEGAQWYGYHWFLLVPKRRR